MMAYWRRNMFCVDIWGRYPEEGTDWVRLLGFFRHRSPECESPGKGGGRRGMGHGAWTGLVVGRLSGGNSAAKKRGMGVTTPGG